MSSRYNPAGHRSTLRVLSIFEALSATKSGLTMAEICRIVGAPKSSLFSILHTMADSDYVSYDETTGRYSIGLKTYLLGKAFDRESGGLSSFETAMRKVVASCGETCQLGVLDHGRVLYISRVDSPQHIRLSSERPFLRTARRLERRSYLDGMRSRFARCFLSHSKKRLSMR